MRRTLSVCLSVRPVIVAIGHVFSAPLASRMYFSARTEGIRTFRHAPRAAYRTAISAAQILVLTTMSLISEKRRGYACDRISFSVCLLA